MDVRKIRRALGLTQTDLAARLGVAQSLISRWETGVRPMTVRDKLALASLLPPRAKRKAA